MNHLILFLIFFASGSEMPLEMFVCGILASRYILGYKQCLEVVLKALTDLEIARLNILLNALAENLKGACGLI